MYEFIQSEGDREEIIAHLRKQVPFIKFHTTRDKVIVLSDVDDTLFQSSALMGGPKYVRFVVTHCALRNNARPHICFVLRLWLFVRVA